jgi:hypothetical protein
LVSLKRVSAGADIDSVRTAHLVALVTALVLGAAAWVWYSHWSSNQGSAAADILEQVMTGPTGQAGQIAALAGAQAAAAAMESFAASSGTYAGATTAVLRTMNPSLSPSATLASATDSGYCVQVSAGDSVAHASGPGGIAQAGPCPA